MSKTNEELTVEIVNNYMTAHSNNGIPPNKQDLLKLLKDVYDTISTLKRG